MFAPQSACEALDDCRTNFSQLARCPCPHDFKTINPIHDFGAQKCTHCGGIVAFTQANWYAMGVLHGESKGRADALKGRVSD